MPNEFKCPFCPKTADKSWKIVNHIRQSRSGEHGPMGQLPPGFNPESLYNTQPNTDLDVKPPTPENDKLQKTTNSNVELINPPKTKIIEIKVCPDCGTPKADWININQLDEATEEEKRVYDYCCPNCKELIRLPHE